MPPRVGLPAGRLVGNVGGRPVRRIYQRSGGQGMSAGGLFCSSLEEQYGILKNKFTSSSGFGFDKIVAAVSM